LKGDKKVNDMSTWDEKRKAYEKQAGRESTSSLAECPECGEKSVKVTSGHGMDGDETSWDCLNCGWRDWR
jgi:DNA-directed RNA polymerase subunit M/transcription elongation factor TFIIS